METHRPTVLGRLLGLATTRDIRTIFAMHSREASGVLPIPDPRTRREGES